MQVTKSIKINQNDAKKLNSLLKNKGFREGKIPNPYVLWRLEGLNTTVMYYSSGSLVSQGEFDVTSLLLEEASSEFKPHLGSDEVGKGDYYGPLVVCSVFVDEIRRAKAIELGVADSKKISDPKIMKIFEALNESVLYHCEILLPARYNEDIRKFKNVAYMLADTHAKCAKSLSEKLDGAKYDCVVDQFSADKGRLSKAFDGVNVNLIQFHKGESDIAVALASVFARAIFLKEWGKMNEKYSLDFPKGATDVINFGKEFVAKYGQQELYNVAKISFRTTSQILSSF